MISLKRALVKKEIETNDFYQVVEVEYEDGEISKAINFLDINKRVYVGQHILSNVTARALNLGTGGYDFILPIQEYERHSNGHIMKLRYTPLQFSVLTEEEKNPDIFNKPPYLNDMVIVVCELHSMILPICIYLKENRKDLKICAILTDWGMLNARLSENIRFLKSNHFLDYTITCGESFNGDFECVNEINSLILAQNIGADIVIISPLPGIVGTGTRFGFSAFYAINVIENIDRFGGKVVFPVRVSMNDARKRHKLLSHHSMTILSYVNSSVDIPIFKFKDQLFFESVYKHLKNYKSKHGIFIIENLKEMIIESYKDILKTMGKGFDEEEAFFLQLFSVGEYILSKHLRS